MLCLFRIKNLINDFFFFDYHMMFTMIANIHASNSSSSRILPPLVINSDIFQTIAVAIPENNIVTITAFSLYPKFDLDYHKVDQRHH